MMVVHHEGAVFCRGVEMLLHKFGVVECAISLIDPFQIVGIGPVSQVGNQPIFDQVAVDVAAQVQQVGLALDRFDAVIAFEERAGMIVAFVVSFGIPGEIRTHNIRIRSMVNRYS